ncbi:MAG: GNAT family N-acetyltransferase [Chloroflexota bacterium]|nr:GNAT family N-acetyltransferase [Chloroflexota bacterium]
MVHEWRRGAYLISTDKRKLDLAVVHGFLATSYWATGVPMEVVERSVEHSLAFGVYEDNRQVGFARVITDRATFAYLADVFILEPWRGKGLGTWLIEVVLSHPELQGLRRWMLATRDAHELYRKAGFTSMASPERFMEIANPDAYVKAHRRVDGTEE